MSGIFEKLLREIPIDSQERISEAIGTLAKGAAVGVATASVATTLTLNDFIHINSGNVVVTVPKASADNKGKVYIVQFTAGTVTATGIDDDADTPNHIVPQSVIAQHDIFLLVSAGSTSLGANGYYVIGWAGAAIA